MFRRQKTLRNSAIIGVSLLGLWCFDKYAYYSTIQRNLRTFYTGMVITLDYKLNFNREKAEQIDQLHERTAKRILDLCKGNGGLYIKFGQQMASVPVLPPPYMKHLKELYDKAPCFEYAIVEQIFLKDFGVLPTALFKSFDPRPIASASIAQVHQATLKTGEKVAVKIQKPEIEKQIKWDMFGYRVVLKALEFFFDLPLYWTADYVEKHIIQEADFLNEVKNAEKCSEYIKEVPALAKETYVPTVFHDICSKRVMTCEWIDGVSLAAPDELTKAGFSKSEIMTTVVNVFSDQLFRTGFVHCDPHPGNILIRKHPTGNRSQIVLLDHGLYVQCEKEFTHQYALFWKSMFSMDLETVKEITSSWGLKHSEMFASATLSRPWKAGKPIHLEKPTVKDMYESQVNAKQKVSDFLQNTDKLPKELIFVGRNLNCVRANNKSLGSPVNRVNLMANYAVAILRESGSTSRMSLQQYASSQLSYMTFHTNLMLISLLYHLTNVWHSILYFFTGKSGKGFESVMDETLKTSLEEEFPGMHIDPNAFDG